MKIHGFIGYRHPLCRDVKGVTLEKTSIYPSVDSNCCVAFDSS